jgi:hypothetical protein
MSFRVALFVRTYSAYGGVENICRQFFHYLKECGVPVRLYCGFDKSGEADPDVVRLPVRRGARSIKAWTFWRSASAAVEQLPAGFVSMAFATVPGCDVFRCGGVHLDYLVKSLRAYASTGDKVWSAAREFRPGTRRTRFRTSGGPSPNILTFSARFTRRRPWTPAKHFKPVKRICAQTYESHFFNLLCDASSTKTRPSVRDAGAGASQRSTRRRHPVHQRFSRNQGAQSEH